MFDPGKAEHVYIAIRHTNLQMGMLWVKPQLKKFGLLFFY